MKTAVSSLHLLEPGSVRDALLMLDSMVNSQAATIAYLNDFRLMMMVVLLATPMLLFLRGAAAPTAGSPTR